MHGENEKGSNNAHQAVIPKKEIEEQSTAAQVNNTTKGLYYNDSQSDCLNFENTAFQSLDLPSPLQPPQASDYLPTMSPSAVYSTAYAVWTPQELELLKSGLKEYPDEKYDSVTRYIKIAATIEGKCVRDVAFQSKLLMLQESKAKEEKKYVNKRLKKEHPLQNPDTGHSTQNKMREEEFLALLQQNSWVINSIRENLMNGKTEGNREHMLTFHNNCHIVLRSLEGICHSIPPLPVTINTSFMSRPY